MVALPSSSSDLVSALSPCTDVLYVGPRTTVVDALEDQLRHLGRRLVIAVTAAQALTHAAGCGHELVVVDTSATVGWTEALFETIRGRYPGLGSVLALVPVGAESNDLFERLLDDGLGGIVIGDTSAQHIVHMVTQLAPDPKVDREPPRVCASCLSLVTWRARTCPTCDAPRPLGGWFSPDDGPLQRLGQRQGCYTLTQLIGTGSTATVYGATHDATGEKVAVKMIDAERLTDRNARGRLQREILALTRIRSAHVVSVHDILTTQRSVAIVMDRAEGINLRHLVESQGPLSVTRVLELAIQLTDALQASHDHGIVHRDVKPANIHVALDVHNVLTTSVVDFGISGLMSAHHEPGIFYGTPAFAAPEQIESPTLVDHRADIYALAGVIYFALTGQRPFPTHSTPELLHHQLTTPFPKLPPMGRPVYDEVVDALNRVLEGMSTKDQTDRFHSMAQVGAALQVILDRARRAHVSFKVVAPEVPAEVDPRDRSELETTPVAIDPRKATRG